MSHKNFSRNFKIKKIVIFVVIAMVGILVCQSAKAADIKASEVLGQINPATNQPDFTQRNINSHVVNNYGFNHEEVVMVDTGLHRLFVADANNNRVLVFNLNNNDELVDYYADNVLGQSNFINFLSNQGGAPGAATMRFPSGLAYNNLNNTLYVSDTYNNRVLVFDVSTITNGEPAVAVLGQSTFANVSANQSGAVSAQTLFNPTSLVHNSIDNILYVSDLANSRVLAYDVNTIVNGEAAVAVLGQPNFISNTFTGVSPTSVFQPRGLAFNNTNKWLYLADSYNNRVLAYDVNTIVNGEAAVAVLGQPNLMSAVANYPNNIPAANNLSLPRGVAFDKGSMKLYVSDSANSRVLAYDVNTIVNGEAAVAVLGQPNFISNSANQGGMLAGATTVNYPMGLALNSYKKLFVADTNNNRVLVFDVSVIVNGEAAASVLGQLDNSSQPNFNQNRINSHLINDYGFDKPKEMAIDIKLHRLFVADTNNNRVLVFNLNNNDELIDYNADSVLGQPDFTSNLPNQGGNTGPGTLNHPSGLAFNISRNLLYVADTNNHRVLVYDVTTIVNGQSAVSVLGQPDFISSLKNNCNCTIPTANSLNAPGNIVYSKNNNILYVGDGGNARVLAYNVTTIVNGESALSVLGKPDFVTPFVNNPPTAENLNQFLDMGGLAYDDDNKILYVSDSRKHRVLAYDVNTIVNGEAAVAVLGQFNFLSGNSNQGGFWPGPGTLHSPVGLVYDKDNKSLFVTDQGNNRVLLFDVATIVNGEAAAAVLGQLNFVSNYPNQGSFLPGQKTLWVPSAVTYNGVNNTVYISDLENNRVMLFKLIDIITVEMPNGTVGNSYNQTVVAQNGQSNNVRYSVSAGSLANGLTLNSVTGLISGTPTVAGTFLFTIKASDNFADTSVISDRRQFKHTIF
ncbi:MAG: putative Ig domain-containing protein [Candidatus Magasanikbacteria bacterium]|nr:putative Ig domain-containing protein [Candidatus Magasanikbacteria bacterium]